MTKPYRPQFNAAAAWPSANRAILIPVVVQVPLTAYKIAIYNGATVAGTVSVGIYRIVDYTTNLPQLVEARAAMSGASQVQTFDITDTPLLPGLYAIGMSSDSSTATFFRATTSSLVLGAAGVQQSVSASYPLPSTIATGNPASAYLPAITVQCAGATI